MTIVTRFAPSPTGYLHIGGGRTALFNYYFAKHMGGKYILRIEDTDRERSTPEAVDAILSGLKWLGVPHDDTPVFQLQNIERHAAVAKEMVDRGQAYYCYMTADEIATAREAAEAQGHVWHYDRRWRDNSETPPAGVKPSIRIKAPINIQGGIPAEASMIFMDGIPEFEKYSIDDKVQGKVSISLDQLDDFILVRADGTPTYMLAVVVDDHDAGVTHVIRGNEHFVNAFRQNMIHLAMGWTPPSYAHVPLIHGEDGKKLSKRTGAASIEEYREMGYLPEALRNYLLRLGWSHGDDEIIDDKQAIEWFTLEGIGKSPSQWDFGKLNFINHHYIKIKNNNELIELIKPILEKKFSTISTEQWSIISKGMIGLKERSQTIIELAKNARFYLSVTMDDGAKDKLNQPHAADVLSAATEVARGLNDWEGKAFIDAVLAKTGFKMGQVGPVLRAALTGTMQSPDMTEVITALGPDEVKARLLQASS
jgi:glutamyl-tRNA synthetase